MARVSNAIVVIITAKIIQILFIYKSGMTFVK
jgi:hypothetical protein